MENIHTLRPGKQRIMALKAPEEEKRDSRPPIAAIDRTHNVPTWKKDFSTV